MNGQTHFQYTSNTDQNATVGVPSTSNPNINGMPLAPGDEIGVFTPAGLCVGAIAWNVLGDAITVWGDDTQTSEIDGIRGGEQIHYRVWQRSTNTEYAVVTVSYSGGGSGTYTANALYMLTALRATAPPNPPVLSSPPAGASNIPSPITFEWEAANFADSYHLQVSSVQDFSSVAVDQSDLVETSFEAVDLAGRTLYYWRVRASNAAGPGAFSGERSFTTAVAPPPVPLPASPADKSVDQPTTLTLVWNTAPGSDSYHVQISGDSSFTTTSVDEPTVTDTALEVGPLTSSSTFFWRVKAQNAGGMSEWSQIWNFATIPLPPATPTLTSPADGAIEQETTLILRWRSSLRAAKYHLQISTSAAFSSIAFQDSTVTDSLLQVGPLLDNVTYHWRVRAGNSGGWSSYSTAWDFTTKSLNAPDAITDPAAEITATSAVLRGTVNTHGLTAEVKFGYGTTPAHGNSVTALESPVNSTSPVSVTNNLRGLQPNTTYHFAVSAFTSAGTTVGENLAFTTDYAVQAPMLASPADSAMNQPQTITFSWNSAAGATGYRLQISTNALFGTLSYDDATIVDTIRVVGPLTRNTTYFWRVQARNSLGSSPWSAVRQLVTVPQEPEAPLLYSPSNGVSEQPLTIKLVWRGSVGADFYRLQVATTSNFNTVVVDSAQVTDTSATVGPLSNNVTYHWRVLAANAGGAGEWSSTWRFTTFVPSPTTPALISPATGSTEVTNPVSFSWTAPAHATSYRLQVGHNQDFGIMDVDDSTITTTSHQVQLAPATAYFWRVRAQNDAGLSVWSDPRNFVTAGASREQQVFLTQGWNMISGYVRPQEPRLDSLCNTAKTNMVLLKNGIGEVYWPDFEINTVGDWNHLDGYQIYMLEGDVLRIQGNALIPAMTAYPLVQGWNMIGYGRSGALEVDSALSGIFNILVIAKNNDGEVYWPEFSINTIGSMTPGEGYQLYLFNDTTLVYPDNDSTSLPSTIATAKGPVESGSRGTYFTYTMNTGSNATVGVPVSAEPKINGVLLDEGDEIGAFTPSGLCIGATVWSGSNAAITVWGDNDQTEEIDGLRPGEQIFYRVWQQSTMQEIQKTTVTYSQGDGMYAPNGIYVMASLDAESPTGVTKTPVVPTEFVLSQNWPNPFNPTTEISFGVPRTTLVRLEVFNVIGQRVDVLVDAVRSPGYHRVSFAAERLPGGIYLYRLSTDGFVAVKKMVLLR